VEVTAVVAAIELDSHAGARFRRGRSPQSTSPSADGFIVRGEVAWNGRAIVCMCDNVHVSQCPDTTIATADVICNTANARRTGPHHRRDVMRARIPCALLETGARLERFLPERPNLVERNGFSGGRCLLTRALLASNPGKRLAQVGFDAVGVTKRTIEDRFHETPPNTHACRSPHRSHTNARCVPATYSLIYSIGYVRVHTSTPGQVSRPPTVQRDR
jgi:hypothetical protein